jgi:FixJ family two-component response regulator
VANDTIAVVEDDPSVLRGIIRLLRAHGLNVLGFASAKAFLDDETAKESACLIIDIHLNGISGLDLHRQLMASGLCLPVIFITADNHETTRQEAIALGCVAYLRKPVAANLLIGAIHKALKSPQLE